MMQNFLLVAINKIVKTAKASMSKKYKLLEKYANPFKKGLFIFINSKEKKFLNSTNKNGKETIATIPK